MNVYTIGHSTHSKETFLTLLNDMDIKAIVDVRALPGSRKYPMYDQENMVIWLKEAGIDYHHVTKLGGRRPTSGDVGITLNAGWNNQSFHNYADYSLSDEFQEGIQTLCHIASEKQTAYLCAERHPSRCHRLLISNVLQANDWSVQHIIDIRDNNVIVINHELGKWGAMPIIESDGTIVYPLLDS